MLEPFGIAVHASLEGSGVSGQTVLVNGCGPIGLMNVAAARALGARRIIAADLNPLRLRTAEKLGADRVVDAARESVAQAAKDLTGGQGVDVGIEYSGTEAGFQAVFDSLMKGGDFRLVGAPPGPIPVDFTYWLLKCPRMVNIHGRRIWRDWETSTALLFDGRVDLTPVASHVLPLSEAARGFELILKGEALKPILIPK
jgi:threonine 3-dehydrogenase